MLKKDFRLRRSNDIRLVLGRGRRIHSPLFSLSYFPSPAGVPRPSTVPSVASAKESSSREGGPRLAFVASRAVSKRAVVRNTLRRRAREWIRKSVFLMVSPLDIVIVFSKSAATAPRKELYEELKRAFAHVTK